MHSKIGGNGRSFLVTAIILFCVPVVLFATGQAEEQEQVIRVAQVMLEDNPNIASMNEEFTEDMAEALEMAVDGRVIMEYGVGIEAMRSGQLDVMLVSPMSYYQAKQRANIEPLVTTGGFGGYPYKTVFVTQSDRDDIETLADLRGRSFAFVDPGSSSGYVYPKLSLVQELDLEPDRIEEPGYFFDTVTYSGRHDASLMGVVMGDYDAAAVGYALIPIMAEAGAIDGDAVKIIAETPDIPNPLYIMRSDLDSEVKDRIRAFYLSYDNEAYFEAVHGDPGQRYIVADEESYQIIYDIVNVLGISEEE